MSDETSAMTTTIRITPSDNGPYRVEGDFVLVLPSGQTVETNHRIAYLCRCGASTRKPFCDGTHSKIGFQAAEAAVEAERQAP